MFKTKLFAVLSLAGLLAACSSSEDDELYGGRYGEIISCDNSINVKVLYCTREANTVTINYSLENTGDDIQGFIISKDNPTLAYDNGGNVYDYTKLDHYIGDEKVSSSSIAFPGGTTLKGKYIIKDVPQGVTDLTRVMLGVRTNNGSRKFTNDKIIMKNVSWCKEDTPTDFSDGIVGKGSVEEMFTCDEKITVGFLGCAKTGNTVEFELVLQNEHMDLVSFGIGKSGGSLDNKIYDDQGNIYDYNNLTFFWGNLKQDAINLYFPEKTPIKYKVSVKDVPSSATSFSNVTINVSTNATGNAWKVTNDKITLKNVKW